jgi:asparagine synthase (glutamine-hydrolysing)
VLHVLEEIHLSALLLRLDATTMAEGVEGRVPYTDRDLVEWVNGLPVGYKVRWRDGEAEQEALGQSALEAAGRLDHSKLLLRISFQGDIPDEVLTRPKAAFPVPLDEWLYGRRHDWARERILTEKMTDLFQRSALETLLDTARGRQEGMKIWMLANVGIWLESYFG